MNFIQNQLPIVTALKRIESWHNSNQNTVAQDNIKILESFLNCWDSSGIATSYPSGEDIDTLNMEPADKEGLKKTIADLSEILNDIKKNIENFRKLIQPGIRLGSSSETSITQLMAKIHANIFHRLRNFQQQLDNIIYNIEGYSEAYPELYRDFIRIFTPSIAEPTIQNAENIFERPAVQDDVEYIRNQRLAKFGRGNKSPVSNLSSNVNKRLDKVNSSVIDNSARSSSGNNPSNPIVNLGRSGGDVNSAQRPSNVNVNKDNNTSTPAPARKESLSDSDNEEKREKEDFLRNVARYKKDKVAQKDYSLPVYRHLAKSLKIDPEAEMLATLKRQASNNFRSELSTEDENNSDSIIWSNSNFHLNNDNRQDNTGNETEGSRTVGSGSGIGSGGIGSSGGIESGIGSGGIGSSGGIESGIGSDGNGGSGGNPPPPLNKPDLKGPPRLSYKDSPPLVLTTRQYNLMERLMDKISHSSPKVNNVPQRYKSADLESKLSVMTLNRMNFYLQHLKENSMPIPLAEEYNITNKTIELLNLKRQAKKDYKPYDVWLEEQMIPYLLIAENRKKIIVTSQRSNGTNYSFLTNNHERDMDQFARPGNGLGAQQTDKTVEINTAQQDHYIIPSEVLLTLNFPPEITAYLDQYVDRNLGGIKERDFITIVQSFFKTTFHETIAKEESRQLNEINSYSDHLIDLQGYRNNPAIERISLMPMLTPENIKENVFDANLLLGRICTKMKLQEEAISLGREEGLPVWEGLYVFGILQELLMGRKIVIQDPPKLPEPVKQDKLPIVTNPVPAMLVKTSTTNIVVPFHLLAAEIARRYMQPELVRITYELTHLGLKTKKLLYMKIPTLDAVYIQKALPEDADMLLSKINIPQKFMPLQFRPDGFDESPLIRTMNNIMERKNFCDKHKLPLAGKWRILYSLFYEVTSIDWEKEALNYVKKYHQVTNEAATIPTIKHNIPAEQTPTFSRE